MTCNHCKYLTKKIYLSDKQANKHKIKPNLN